MKNLTSKWKKESELAFKEAKLSREHAGHSNSPEATGDEGWVSMIEMYERAYVLQRCAQELEAAMKKDNCNG